MKIVINDCVGCPQGCIHCGRSAIPGIKCDECGYEDYNDNVDMYKVNGKDICLDCLKKSYRQEIIDSMIDEMFDEYAKTWAEAEYCVSSYYDDDEE